ncbi:protein FAM177A1-like [Labeo rohita]|uniref:Protein FAM177A1-like n=1 Tax=Labeo rohita TaxID=84645 RepID=A0A498N6M0_LABRO|nr:protein FAM177A1-like [Labeo rohita]
MAELSLYLTNVNVSLGQTMDTEKSSTVVKEFESVELGDLSKKKPKIPRRTIYFASGETMEEYSTDEEEEEEPEKAKTISKVDPSKLTWGPYVWFQMWRVATSTISVCDYLGEKMASLLGITTPKYQYAIDEYYRMKKEVRALLL